MKPADRPLTRERLLEVLSYDPLTGIFRWRVCLSRRNHIGDQAGTIGEDGYRIIQIDGWHYKASRLAWLYHRGRWPDPQAMLAWDEFGDDTSTEFLVQITADRLGIETDEVYAALAEVHDGQHGGRLV